MDGHVFQWMNALLLLKKIDPFIDESIGGLSILSLIIVL